MKLVAISDLHGKWNKITIPECDVLISAGDYSFKGEPWMVKNFHKWMAKQPAKHFISVQGNHELEVEKDFANKKLIAQEQCPNVHFIDEGLVEIEGIKIWGSAITPYFHNWAWNKHRGEEIKPHWDKIPDDIDVLVTHGPPRGILDEVNYVDGTFKEHVGCDDLYNRILQLSKCKIHIFGHIHSGYGFKAVHDKHFFNASICDEMYMPTNAPWEIEI